MGHSRGSRFPRRSARSTSWELGPSEVNGGFTLSGAALWAGTVTTSLPKSTLIRLRGLVRVTLLTAGSAGDGFFGAYGIGLFTKEAVAIGVTAVPTPLSDENWDGWIWHSYWDVRSTTATIADGVNAGGVVKDVDIDSKAMRIWTDEYTLLGVSEAVESGVATCEIQGSSRALIKLS